jgi:hypothetical protein
MTLIKCSNLRLRNKHPFVLNLNKKHKLGASHMMFSLDTAIYIMFKVNIIVRVKNNIPGGFV